MHQDQESITISQKVDLSKQQLIRQIKDTPSILDDFVWLYRAGGTGGTHGEGELSFFLGGGFVFDFQMEEYPLSRGLPEAKDPRLYFSLLPTDIVRYCLEPLLKLTSLPWYLPRPIEPILEKKLTLVHGYDHSQDRIYRPSVVRMTAMKVLPNGDLLILDGGQLIRVNLPSGTIDWIQIYYQCSQGVATSDCWTEMEYHSKMDALSLFRPHQPFGSYLVVFRVSQIHTTQELLANNMLLDYLPLPLPPTVSSPTFRWPRLEPRQNRLAVVFFGGYLIELIQQQSAHYLQFHKLTS